jgi:glucans biosynthesis protein
MNLSLRVYLSLLLILSPLSGHGQESSPLLGAPKIRLDDPGEAPSKPSGTKVPDPPPSTTPPSINSQDGVTFDKVRSLANELALKPYVNRTPALAPVWKELTVTDANKITFRPEHALWHADRLGYAIEFMHPSSAAPYVMQLADITAGVSHDLPWDSSHFDYHDMMIPEGSPPPSGFAGWKLLLPLNTPDQLEPIIEFGQRASFRGRAPALLFGVNCSALVLNPDTENEELPQFQRFWFEHPTAPNKSFNFYALLDSPSVAGAYRFKLMPGTSSTLEVEAELVFRQQVKEVGLASLLSRCWFSELSTPKPTDYRPEVHSSDGLLVHLSEAEAVWRPLDVGPSLRRWEIQSDRLLGFGLVQRDRQFASYQDLEENYQLQPSAYIRPVGKWPSGKVCLVEHPTADSHTDNVHAYWQPETSPKVGQPFRFGYLLHWSGDVGAPGLSKIISSRRSQELFTPAEDRPNLVTFVVDYSQSASLEVDQKEVIAAVAVGTGAKLLGKTMQKNPATGGWRVIFRLQIEPTTTKLELNCRLLCDGRPISERWNYQWTK